MKKNCLTAFLLVAFVSVFTIGCKKEVDPSASTEEFLAASNAKQNGHLKQTKTFSSDVVTSWLGLQLTMFRIPLPPGTGSQATDRAQAYCGIALYEAVVQGMPAYQTLYGQLTDFPKMPSTEPGKAYHWGASANAALAEMYRRLFPTTADANKTAVNVLEANWNNMYATEVEASTLERSVAFGKEVATRVANWAATDGSANVNPPYVAPVGFGLWIPTSPTPPVGPYTYQRRLLVPGSNEGTTPTPPPVFSTSPTSDFYKMVKEIYDASLVLTADQKAMADYFKDNPGYSPGGGFVSILLQALNRTKPTLDKAALTYVQVGLAQNDATILLFTDKYIFNTMRPVTYIRAYINPSWNTYIPTPNHPEFPSGHATTNGAVLTMMSNAFGEHFPMTLHTYDYLGYPSRSYETFTQMGREMADSRFYGGLHYRPTCEKSLKQGRKVAENILSKVKFMKG